MLYSRERREPCLKRDINRVRFCLFPTPVYHPDEHRPIDFPTASSRFFCSSTSNIGYTLLHPDKTILTRFYYRIATPPWTASLHPPVPEYRSVTQCFRKLGPGFRWKNRQRDTDFSPPPIPGVYARGTSCNSCWRLIEVATARGVRCIGHEGLLHREFVDKYGLLRGGLFGGEGARLDGKWKLNERREHGTGRCLWNSSSFIFPKIKKGGRRMLGDLK